MSRPTLRLLRFPLVFVLIAIIGGCAGTSPEEQLLTTFFRAARVRDNATLANIATVQFNPRTEGSVQSFEVTNLGAEQRRTLQVQQLMDEEAEAQAADEELSKRKREYQDANMPALQRISDAQRKGDAIKGADAEMVAVWNKWGEDQVASKKRLTQARSKTRAESSIAIGSLTPAGQPDIDIKGMELEVVTREVTVSAPVRSAEGQESPKTIVLTLQRAVGKKDGQTREGRWLITGLQMQDAAS